MWNVDQYYKGYLKAINVRSFIQIWRHYFNFRFPGLGVICFKNIFRFHLMTNITTSVKCQYCQKRCIKLV